MEPRTLSRIARIARALLVVAPALHLGPAAAARWVTGYYAAYSVFPPASMAPGEIDYAALTHVIHWPVVPRADGSLVDPDTYGLTAAQSADLVARAHAAGTRALLGFGGDAVTVGDGWRGATSPANRSRFIGRMVVLMRERGYDGIDLNWEELDPADEAQFVAFVGELRHALDAITPRPLLTWVPTTGDRPPLAATAATAQHFDQINLQTYVMSGPYDGWVTWFNSPLRNGGAVFPSTGGPLPAADVEVERYIAAGVPAERLGLGVQFDGFVWSGGAGTASGGVTAPRQDFDDARPPAVTPLRVADVLAQYGADPGCSRHFDAVAAVPWIGCDRARDADDRFVSFEDERSIDEKAGYVASRGLGGMFVFELSGDYQPAAAAGARHPLLGALKAALRTPPAPAALLGLVDGSSVALSWTLAPSDPPPTELALAVSGTIETTLRLPVGEQFSVADVPPGTYRVTLGAVGAAGSSAPSNELVLTVPAACSGTPAVPTGLTLERAGDRVTARWQAPTQGAAVTSYVVEVGGAWAGRIVTTERVLSGTLAPGRYTATVSATNPCGSSAPTAPRAIDVPQLGR